MTYEEAIAFLNSRIRFGMRPGTERVAALMEALGHPQNSYPVLHVSGTNGKFSVVQIAAAILTELGMTVGTYTSPDLGLVRERIQLAGLPIDEESFAGVLGYLTPYVEMVEASLEDELTYFELLTAMGFEAFFDRAVHAAVVEAGLGGEYDATNVAEAQAGVLTNVSLDHIRQFGGDLAKAAWEKSGIAKAGSTLVCGVEQDDLFEVVQTHASERGADRVVRLGRDIELCSRQPAIGGQVVSIRTLRAQHDDLFLPLFGEHQARNAVMAATACEVMKGEALEREALERGLAAVRTPGRMEVFGRRPMVVLDGGHNPEAARMVTQTVAEAFSFERLILVMGMVREKLIDEVLQAWAAMAPHRLVVCAPESERAAPAAELASAAERLGIDSEKVVMAESVETAVGLAIQEASESDLVMVFGSFYTVSQARSWLRAQGALTQS